MRLLVSCLPPVGERVLGLAPAGLVTAMHERVQVRDPLTGRLEREHRLAVPVLGLVGCEGRTLVVGVEFLDRFGESLPVVPGLERPGPAVADRLHLWDPDRPGQSMHRNLWHPWRPGWSSPWWNLHVRLQGKQLLLEVGDRRRKLGAGLVPLRFSPDERWLALSGARWGKVYDCRAGKWALTRPGACSAADFCPRSGRLALGLGSQVELHDMSGSRPRRMVCLQGDTGPVLDVWFPSPRYVLARDEAGCVGVWELDEQAKPVLYRTLELGAEPTLVRADLRGTLLCLSDGHSYRLYRLPAGEPLPLPGRFRPRTFGRIEFSRSSSLVASSLEGQRTRLHLDDLTWEPLTTEPSSPDGRWRLLLQLRHGVLHQLLVEVESGRPVDMPASSWPVWSPDGGTWAGPGPGQIRFYRWGEDRWEVRARLRSEGMQPVQLSFEGARALLCRFPADPRGSPSGYRLVEVETGRTLWEGPADFARMSPDGRGLARVAEDGLELLEHRLDEVRCLARLAPGPAPLCDVCWDRDRVAMLAGGELLWWESPRERLERLGQVRHGLALALQPGGHWLVVGCSGDEPALEFWDLRVRELRARLRHFGADRWLCETGDGRFEASPDLTPWVRWQEGERIHPLDPSPPGWSPGLLRSVLRADS